MANETDAALDINAHTLTVDLRTHGSSGLRHAAGLIQEDELPQLEGKSGLAIFKEMGDNDAVCSTIMFMIDKLCRQVDWRTESASSMPFDEEASDFLWQCLNDMEQSLIEVVSEILTMLQYGFAPLEICYKRRTGNSNDPVLRSKFNDGRIGWRGLPIRSQDTIWRWHFADNGDIVAMEQLAPPLYQNIVIPMDKILLFRTSVHKNNPQGKSIFRGAYRSWYMKRGIENIEAVGIERDLAGLPMAFVPPQILAPNASAAQKTILAEMKRIVTNVRRDEQEGIIFPLAYDEKGNKLYDFKLMTSGGARQFDVDKVIQRYDQRIALCALSDFLLLGQGSGAQGSWAMHSDKTKLFAVAISAFLDIIAETFNRFAVPRLFALNDLQISDYPKIAHGGIEKVDLKELGDYVQKLCASGMPLFPDTDVERYLRKAADLPEPLEGEANIDQQVQPQHEEPPDNVVELHDKPNPAKLPDAVPAKTA